MDQILLLVAMFSVMYLVLILPQQRSKRKHAALLASLVEGDEVVLNSGIHGFVGALEESVLWIEVANGTELKVSRTAVATKVENVEEEPDEDSEE